jgi:GT2 family glycosyltransferase
MDPAARAERFDASWVTVVISTCDRAGAVARCVASVLRNQYPGFDLLVVDQSSDRSTEAAVREFQADPRLRYVRSEVKGLSAGRNLGIGRARGEMIACTDDDCETPPDWLSRMAAALRHDDRTAVVFGNVRPGAHDRAAGFVPGYLWKSPFLARSIRDEHHADGMSGCMGLRRSAWERLGGFDEFLGAGSPFRAAEEMDFAIRALLAGFRVYVTPEVEVAHYGFRSWEEGHALIQGYLYGIGAMIAKHLKCGNWGILHYVTHLFWRWAFAGPVVDFGRRPPRWLRLRAFVLGAKAGLACAVERPRSLYRGGRVVEDRMGAGAVDREALRGGDAEPEYTEEKPRFHGD